MIRTTTTAGSPSTMHFHTYDTEEGNWTRPDDTGHQHRVARNFRSTSSALTGTLGGTQDQIGVHSHQIGTETVGVPE